jgi:hypothetical protein
MKRKKNMHLCASDILIYTYIGRINELGINMEKRVKVGFFLSDSLIEKLRLLIMQKYQKYERGLLSYEVEQALRAWLALHTNSQKSLEQQKLPNPSSKVAITFAQVKQYLLSHYYFELHQGQQIPLKHLKEAIMNVRGSDPRTVSKWLKTFESMHLIKPVTSATWELL